MKRTIAFVAFIMMVLLSVAFADESDILYAEKGVYILKENSIEIYVNGLPDTDTSLFTGRQLVIPIVIENKSDKNITLIAENGSVNGWACECSVSGAVPAGKKKKTELSFNLKETEVDSLDEFEEAEFSLHAYDTDNWFGEKVLPATAPIVLKVKPKLEDVDDESEKVDGHLLEILKNGSTTYSETEKASDFDPSLLEWNSEGKISLSMESWKAVKSLERNLFYDTGEGFIDFGLDPDFEIEGSDLVYQFDGTGLTIDEKMVAYYYLYTKEKGEEYLIRGYIPALLNGVRMNIIIDFTNEKPYGFFAGAMSEIPDAEKPDSIDASMVSIGKDDHVQFVSRLISYDGKVLDSCKLGDEIILGDTVEICNRAFRDLAQVKNLYRFIDNDGNEYWTPVFSK